MGHMEAGAACRLNKCFTPLGTSFCLVYGTFDICYCDYYFVFEFLGLDSLLALYEPQEGLCYLDTIVVVVRPTQARGVQVVSEHLCVVPELNDLAYDLARKLWVPLHRDRLAREEEALGSTDVVLAQVLRALGI